MAYKCFDRFIAGLRIFQKNLPGDFVEELCPEHDVVYFSIPYDTTLSKEVVAQLEGVGWHQDEDELERFYFFT